MFERILDWYCRAYGWSVTALRYFNASGATAELGERHDPETHIIPLLLQAAAGERKVFNIYGDEYDTPDGTCVRDYVHVLDIASAHICALQNLNRPGMRAYNIGLGKSYSVREVCNAAAEVTGRAIPLRVSARREGDPAVLVCQSQSASCMNWAGILNTLPCRKLLSLHGNGSANNSGLLMSVTGARR